MASHAEADLIRSTFGHVLRLPLEFFGKRASGGLAKQIDQSDQIARILASEPHILVMDEATANLDYATELEMKQALAHLRNQPTMMVIAHRCSMVKDADHVIVLDAGRVVEEGAPEGLITSGGWFAQIAQGNEKEANGDETDEETGEGEEDEEDDEP